MLSVVLQGRVVGYAHEPCSETGPPGIVAAKALEGFHQCVLCCLLGFFGRRNQAGHHPQHLPGISAGKLTEQRGLSVEDAADEQRLVFSGFGCIAYCCFHSLNVLY